MAVAIGVTSVVTRGSGSFPSRRLHKGIPGLNNGKCCGGHPEQILLGKEGDPLPEGSLSCTATPYFHGARSMPDHIFTIACIAEGNGLP